MTELGTRYRELGDDSLYFVDIVGELGAVPHVLFAVGEDELPGIVFDLQKVRLEVPILSLQQAFAAKFDPGFLFLFEPNLMAGAC